MYSGNLQGMQLGRGHVLRGIDHSLPVLSVPKTGRERRYDAGCGDSEQERNGEEGERATKRGTETGTEGGQGKGAGCSVCGSQRQRWEWEALVEGVVSEEKGGKRLLDSTVRYGRCVHWHGLVWLKHVQILGGRSLLTERPCTWNGRTRKI